MVLDPRDENLEVNRLRHGTHENLRFVRGDILKPEAGYKEYKPGNGTAPLEFPGEGFDLIFMAGTLEQYKKEEAEAVLKAAAGLLKPEGTLYFAAENAAGVRYWMGAERFDVSFLRAEVLELLESLEGTYGGSSLLYYPVPDYRYPAAVYSDAYLPENGEVTNISARLDGPGLTFGSEEQAMAMAMQERSIFQLCQFVPGSVQERTVMRQIIYVKYNRTRSEKFQLKTAIVRENGALSVEKTALTEAGAGHMGSFWEKYQMIREQNPRIRFLEPEFKDGGKTVCFRYLEGETLADALADRIHMGQIPYEELERVMALVFPEDFSVDGGNFSIKEQAGSPFIPSRSFTEVFGPVPEGLEELGRLTAAPMWMDYLKIS